MHLEGSFILKAHELHVLGNHSVVQCPFVLQGVAKRSKGDAIECGIICTCKVGAVAHNVHSNVFHKDGNIVCDHHAAGVEVSDRQGIAHHSCVDRVGKCGIADKRAWSPGIGIGVHPPRSELNRSFWANVDFRVCSHGVGGQTNAL